MTSNFALGANAGCSAAVEVYDRGYDEITRGDPVRDAGTRDLGEPLELPTSGTYAVVIRPTRSQTRSFRLRLRT